MAVLETTGSPAEIAKLLDRDPEVVERARYALQTAWPTTGVFSTR